MSLLKQQSLRVTPRCENPKGTFCIDDWQRQGATAKLLRQAVFPDVRFNYARKERAVSSTNLAVISDSQLKTNTN